MLTLSFIKKDSAFFYIPLYYYYTCIIHYIESLEWCVLRYGDIGRNGVDYKPVIPVKETIHNDINNILL